MADMVLSPKYKAFIKANAKVEVLEGTTASGKTTVGVFKFILKVRQSPKKLHILSGLDLGTIEKNIIIKDLGILDNFGQMVEYNPHGKGENRMAHIELKTGKDSKIIYVLGYDDRTRWKKALGGQYGCLYIDEINIADIDFVRESMMRADYVMATLNPDNPALPVYDEYINHCRPLEKWASDTPKEINDYLEKVEPYKDWVYWFFSFDHNYGLTADKIEVIKRNVPKGTKLYKNKILGLRGKSTGLVFNLEDDNLITVEQAEQRIKNNVLYCTAGLDTSYSLNSQDTFAMTFFVVTADRVAICTDVKVYNNKDLSKPLTPSDIPPLFEQFLEQNRQKWGFARDVFIDSADQRTILECKKYKHTTGSIYNYLGAWKKTTIIDRINLQAGWMAQRHFLLVKENCKPMIDELNVYSWKEDKYEPEDSNDHTINSAQYAWLPFKDKIGAIQK